MAGLAIVLGAVAVVVVLAQVEVSDPTSGVTRTCGSAFDGAVDRSGWEVWWARDLDEPDPVVRDELVRTSRCPDAVNTRLVVAGVLGGGALVLALAATVASRQRRQPRASEDRIARLGRRTFVSGLVLTLAGVVAIVVLVSDADSTLFLYTDRLVVAVVGLIVLVPTAALVVLGRALEILGTERADPGDPRAVDEGAGHGAGDG